VYIDDVTKNLLAQDDHVLETRLWRGSARRPPPPSSTCSTGASLPRCSPVAPPFPQCAPVTPPFPQCSPVTPPFPQGVPHFHSVHHWCLNSPNFAYGTAFFRERKRSHVLTEKQHKNTIISWLCVPGWRRLTAITQTVRCGSCARLWRASVRFSCQ